MDPRQQDIGSYIKPDQTINQNYGGSSDVTGDTVDMLPQNSNDQYSSVTFSFDVRNGSGGDTLVFKLQESADNSNWTALNDEDGTQFSVTINDASGEAEIDVSNLKHERYVRAVTLQTDNTVGSTTDIAACAVKGGAKEGPV